MGGAGELRGSVRLRDGPRPLTSTGRHGHFPQIRQGDRTLIDSDIGSNNIVTWDIGGS